VNGKQFKVVGIIESASGPGGRDGYIHIQDAMALLRMNDMEISEIAIRVKDFNQLDTVYRQFSGMLSKERNKKGRPLFEVHSWEKLSPFSRIAKMIDVMTFFIKLMLTAIVLISIMNVMIMAVYERIREIGTIAAIGTLPGKIRAMFVIEGFCMGVIGAVTGCILSEVAIFFINVSKITFDFGRNKGLLLSATINPQDLLMISAIVVVVSILASLQPAFKASRMDPIQALRHV